MPYTRLRYHIIIATKRRFPWIDEEVRDFLYPVIRRQFSLNDGTAITIGGIEDHVHILGGIRPEVSVDSLIKSVKKDSAKAVRKRFVHRRKFKWQVGYTCFTTNPFDMGELIAYIENQREHHG